ncbi:MAG: oligosaccharide flippase family protein [Bacteroidota bacterium]
MISKQVTKNFLFLFLSNVIGQLFTLAGFIHLARIVGAEGFGRFSFAQVVALFFLYLADFGLQTLGTRAVAQKSEAISKYVWEVTILRAVLAGGCFLLLVVSSFVFPPFREVRSLIIIFGFALFPSAVLFEWVFQGLEQMEYVALGRVLKGIVFAGLVFVFVHTSEHLKDAALFYVTGIAVAAALLIRVYFRKYGLVWGKMDRVELKHTLVAAVPLAAGSFITQVNYNFGTIALGLFLTNKDVGLFSAAYKIVLFLLAFAAVAAANAVFPLMARSYKKSMTLFSHSLKNLLRVFVLVAIPVGIGGCILAPRIMGFLYSPEYQEGIIVLQLSIWMVVIVIYRMIFENVLIAAHNQRNYLVGYMLAGALTILGNLLLVPVLGLVAPAMVGIFSESALLVYFVTSCKFVRFSYVLRVTVKPLLAGSIMGLALWILPLSLFVLVAVGIVTYFALLLVFRALTVEEVTAYVHSLVR